MNVFLEIAESFSVGCPHDDHLVNLILLFKFSDVFSDCFKVLLFVRALEYVSGSAPLIACNKIFVINSWPRDHIFGVFFEILDEIPLQNLSSFHGFIEVVV